MRSDAVIRLRNVSKAFRQYSSPKDRLMDLLFKKSENFTDFQALKSIDLEIKRGQTVGIVGKNGAGKSTLLQIIAGTLTQSSGTVEINGSLSALLELGSGFNPDFTGHENIYFNGQILGYSREQIDAKYQEIVGFADIGEFIHQPVKTYSTGMSVRLAFAVATCHNPEILIVDEALAVGDEVFQRKCYARLERMRENGTTILFVSHSASSVIQLCDHAILLDQGEVLLQDAPKNVIAKYHKLIYATGEQRERIRKEILEGLATVESAPETHSVERKSLDNFDPELKSASLLTYQSRGAIIEEPRLLSAHGERVNMLNARGEYIYAYRVRFIKDCHQVRFGMLIKTPQGLGLSGAASHLPSQAISQVKKGSVFEVRFKFNCLLVPGFYLMNAGVLGTIDDEEIYLHRLIDALIFRVQPESQTIATGIADFLVEPATYRLMGSVQENLPETIQ